MAYGLKASTCDSLNRFNTFKPVGFFFTINARITKTFFRNTGYQESDYHSNFTKCILTH